MILNNMIISIISLIASIFLPDLFIGKYLSYLRKKDKKLEEFSKKYENENLRIYSKILGNFERIIFWTLLLTDSYTALITFFVAWVGLKVATNYTLWSGLKDGEHHLGRALFLIFFIGNLLSLVSVILIVFLAGKLL